MPYKMSEINVVGGSVFGRYPKISIEKTYNMYVSDGWLVNAAGYKKVADADPDKKNVGIGRGIFNSIRGGFLITVVGKSVYRIEQNLFPVKIGEVESEVGDVSIDENLVKQICIVDGLKAYVYYYGAIAPGLSFTTQDLQHIQPNYQIYPNYVCYHNDFFLFGSSPSENNSQYWYAFTFDAGDPGPPDPTKLKLNFTFALQTKPDSALAIKRLPGKGNNVLVMGGTVSEIWTNVGGQEGYRRAQSVNIDYGVVSTETIAASDLFLCFLSQNENSVPSITFTDGTSFQRISTDGIDYLMDSLVAPKQSTGFFYKQDGHLFYQLTFYNSQDNLSLVYDFTNKMFFHASDESLNFHPAQNAVYYNSDLYFLSIRNGDLFLMNTDQLSYKYTKDNDDIEQEIPRIRICKTLREPDSSRFRVRKFTFWIEQGVNNYSDGDPIVPRIDMSICTNGNQSFSNTVSHDLNTVGNYRNQVRFHRLGQANEFTIQLRFLGYNRWVINNGVAEIIM